MKKILLLVILVIIGIAAYLFLAKPNPQTPSGGEQNPAGENKPERKLSPLTAKYIVEGRIVSLENGKEETVSPYGAAKQVTESVGDPLLADLNSDGESDYALIIKQYTENDIGVYYYAAIALADEKTGVIAGSNAVPLGDRIVIKDTAIVNQAFRINYLDWRTDGDNVEASPTLPMTKSYILDGVMLKELTEKRANAQAEAACTDNSGAWDKEKRSCSGLTKEWCDQNAGKFENNLCNF
ncbi:MAG: hypothetical protein MUD10_03300 [Candidatus Pacebacteria bacterium]|jgi:hypothetical protein|nr:hypothetical protein [Candidatus Paceibacterota bacterium]